MTADQSPDLVTALQAHRLVGPNYRLVGNSAGLSHLKPYAQGDWQCACGVGGNNGHLAHMQHVARAILDAHPTPAQSSEQEVVALREEVERLRWWKAEVEGLEARNEDAWEKHAQDLERQRDDALARLAALPTALTSDAAVEAAARALYNRDAGNETAWERDEIGDGKWKGYWRKDARAALAAALATLPTEGGE